MDVPPESPEFDFAPPPGAAPAAPEPERYYPELRRPASDAQFTYCVPFQEPDLYSRLALIACCAGPFVWLFGWPMPHLNLLGAILGATSLVRQKRNPALSGAGTAWLAIVLGLGFALFWFGLTNTAPLG